MTVKIPLVRDTVSKEDIHSLIEWLQTYPQLTKGQQTLAFEKKFAEWNGSKYAVFVNSGSSANLLMLSALKVFGMSGRKIAVPALSWATDLSPVMELGFTPVLVDCNLENLSVDLNHLRTVFEQRRPVALLLVSVLGLSPDMDAIQSLCDEFDVILLEDNCESQGTKYRTKNLGTFGAMSSFSTYFGHIMSTVEGGVITTDYRNMYETLLMLRSHGWSRDISPETAVELRKQWNVDDFSERFTFYFPGYNLRPTDIQAVIGLRQLERIDAVIARRTQNFHYIRSALDGKMWTPTETPYSTTANFCYPIIANSVEHKQRLIETLTKDGIECRPLIAGSMGTQPMYKRQYGELLLPNATVIDSRGLYIPNNPDLTVEEMNYMTNSILSTL